MSDFYIQYLTVSFYVLFIYKSYYYIFALINYWYHGSINNGNGEIQAKNKWGCGRESISDPELRAHDSQV